MSDDIVKKRGRPAKEGAKRNPVQTKFSDDELDDLRVLSKRDGKSVSEILRIGYRLYKKSSDDMAALFEDEYDDDEYYD